MPLGDALIVLTSLFTSLGIIVSTASILSVALRRLHQPKVIAEIVGGIILGMCVTSISIPDGGAQGFVRSYCTW